jgi:hypothetical protein
MRRAKREPVGWLGAVEGKGPGASLGKGRWRVIDSQGNLIASGFTTRALALRWIDGFNLIRAGYPIDDRKWHFSHWYPAQPARLDPEPRAPTESSDASVLIPTETEGVAAAGYCRNKTEQV